MSNNIEVVVPDIGDFADVEIIEILVATGDTVNVDDALITLESDKATMDVPSPAAGTVREIPVAIGDKVSEGSLVAQLETESEASQAEQTTPDETQATTTDNPAPASESEEITVSVPDIGDFDQVDVIEVHVAVGDTVKTEDPLITLESDKATMDVPSSSDGVVKSMLVNVGDQVSEGSNIAILSATSKTAATQTEKPETAKPTPVVEQKPLADDEDIRPQTQPVHRPPSTLPPLAEKAVVAPPHASPGVRRYARELGTDITKIRGSGPKGRILKEDVKAFIKSALEGKRTDSVSGSGVGIPAMPEVDFSKFGETEAQELPRIKRISGPHLHRAWLNVPHVTHHDEADITELEAFRQSLKDEAAKKNVRVTMLAFIMKAVTAGLKEFPNINASLSSDGQRLILKKYFHVGIAVDTPIGLVVPVFRDVDKKSIFDLAEEMGEVSLRAREGKLTPTEMQGGCISISSLGGIGGTAFTPIVNAPEVAILGVTRARMQPVWNGEKFKPRLMLPLDLSYDHRVIDGAAAARFVAYLCTALADMRRILL
ncbi:MAG: dihydrolipoyllysine-residue acetyltransferase [Gammaproteobacteria bacterium]|nr:dihydrolipoyllysine-residue acetyltransferase [Gammaproteobacteria bacterium]